MRKWNACMLKKGMMLHRKLISNVSIFKCRMRLRINELENDLWYFVLRLLFCVLVLFFVLFWFSNFLFFQFLKANIYLFFFRVLKSQHGSKLSSLGPFEAFFKLERAPAEIILWVECVVCLKKIRTLLDVCSPKLG